MKIGVISIQNFAGSAALIQRTSNKPHQQDKQKSIRAYRLQRPPAKAVRFMSVASQVPATQFFAHPRIGGLSLPQCWLWWRLEVLSGCRVVQVRVKV